MANYSTDLVDLDLCEDANSMNQIGSGNISLGSGVDYVFQGTNAVDAKISGNITKGMMSDKLGTITNSATKHFFVWCQCATAGAMDIKSNGGKSICIGSGTSAYVAYHVDGKDTNLEGGYKVYPIAYDSSEARGGTAIIGSPATNPSMVGARMNNTGVTVKSGNFSVDAIRHGDGTLYVDGTGATFLLAAAWSSDGTRKWGITVVIEGGVALRGQMNIGQNSSGTPTSCTFTDSDKLIAFSDTEFTNTDFTQINIDHASTVVNLTNITFLAIGTNNRGEINGLNASSTVNFTTCNMNGINTTSLEAGWTMLGCFWNGADQITQNGATITGGGISVSTNAVALIVDDLSLITKVNFVGDNTGHAMDLGTVAASGTISWDNTFDTSTYALTDGSTGNEVILVNYTDTGADLIINVAAGSTPPTVYNTGGGTVVVQAGFVLTLKSITSGARVTIVNSSTRAVLQDNISTGADITYPHGGGEIVDILIIDDLIDPNLSDVYDLTLPTSDSEITFRTFEDINFENP